MSKHGIMVAGVTIGILLLLLVGTVTGRIVSGSGVCGNQVCELGENPRWCPSDCIGTCGNGICEPAEELSCKVDCEVKPLEKQVSLLDGILKYFNA